MIKQTKKLKSLRDRANKLVTQSNEVVEGVNEKIINNLDEVETLQSIGNSAVAKRESAIVELSKEKQAEFDQFTRKWSLFCRLSGSEVYLKDSEHIFKFIDFLSENEDDLPKKRIAMVFICLNQQYWEFAKNAISGAKKYFLPGHEVDYFLWSDVPEEITREQLLIPEEAKDRALEAVEYIRNDKHITVFPTESVPWPHPTLMRYHLFLQKEEILSKYDYIFYCDVDMAWNDIVGDEILGDKLTVARHPMYAHRDGIMPPTEPNPESSAYIKNVGKIEVRPDNTPYFNHVYGAGGFQGGKSDVFINAMRIMKKRIDEDMDRGYIARWNDESHWNRYLYDHPEEISVVLSPSYVYPDSLINEYYVKIWGKNYHPRLITLTKKFTTSKEAGQHIEQQLKTL